MEEAKSLMFCSDLDICDLFSAEFLSFLKSMEVSKDKITAIWELAIEKLFVFISNLFLFGRGVNHASTNQELSG